MKKTWQLKFGRWPLETPNLYCLIKKLAMQKTFKIGLWRTTFWKQKFDLNNLSSWVLISPNLSYLSSLIKKLVNNPDFLSLICLVESLVFHIPNLSYLYCLIKNLAIKKTLKLSFLRRPWEQPKVYFQNVSSWVIISSHSQFELSV